MQSYKVEILRTEKYVVDVQADDEQEATDKATAHWGEIVSTGTCHLYQIGDTEEEVGVVYDVTGTDDEVQPQAPRRADWVDDGSDDITF